MDLDDGQEAIGATDDRASPSESEAGQHADAIPLERRKEKLHFKPLGLTIYRNSIQVFGSTNRPNFLIWAKPLPPLCRPVTSGNGNAN
jgi:hypothetical protein